MANQKRYVLVQTYSVDEFAMPTPPVQGGDNDPRARLNVNALREVAKADVVIAMDPSGAAVVVFDADIENEEYGPGSNAVVTTIYATPVNWA